MSPWDPLLGLMEPESLISSPLFFYVIVGHDPYYFVLSFRYSLQASCELHHLLTDFIRPELVDGVECEGCTRRYREALDDQELSPRKSIFSKQATIGKVKRCSFLDIQQTIRNN